MTRRGEYWVATWGGLYRFNPKVSYADRPPAGKSGHAARADGRRSGANSQQRFVVYRLSENPNANQIRVLLEDRLGDIWCGTSEGVYRLEESNGRWIPRLVNLALPAESVRRLKVNALLLDKRGDVWIATDTGLFRHRPDGGIELYNQQQGGLPWDGISALFEDQESRLWVSTPYGLCRLVAEPRPTQPAVEVVYTTKDGLLTNWIGALYQSSDGSLWASGGGLSVSIPPALPTGRWKFRSYSQAHDLTDTGTNALIEDRHGNLWVGTESAGAMKIVRNGFTTYTEADGLKYDRIGAISEDHEQKLIVFPGGPTFYVHQFNGQRFNAVHPNLPPSITYMGWGGFQVHFQDHTGEWWVATGQGLCRFPKGPIQTLARNRPKAVYTTRDGLIDNIILRLYEDSRGDIWIGCYTSPPNIQHGFIRWCRATETFQRFSPSDGIPELGPQAFQEDPWGNVWIGFYVGGLARYREGRFSLFTSADGLPAGAIRGLYVDSARRLWVAGARGVARVDDLTAERPRFVQYTTNQGLSTNDTWTITEDRWGRI